MMREDIEGFGRVIKVSFIQPDKSRSDHHCTSLYIHEPWSSSLHTSFMPSRTISGGIGLEEGRAGQSHSRLDHRKGVNSSDWGTPVLRNRRRSEDKHPGRFRRG